jgi:hypothetical protein
MSLNVFPFKDGNGFSVLVVLESESIDSLEPRGNSELRELVRARLSPDWAAQTMQEMIFMKAPEKWESLRALCATNPAAVVRTLGVGR